MFTHSISPIFLTLLLLLAYPALAQEHHEDEHHEEEHHKEDDHHDEDDHDNHAGNNLEAHDHGTAELFIISEGQKLEIELHSPAANLLGFEHEPRNDEQRAAVENLKTKLANANDLFDLSSAACELSDQDIELGHLTAENDAHDDHGDEHHGDHEDANTHSDIEVKYSYDCEKLDSISSLVTTIPSEFPGVESLEVQWIVNGRQGAVTLENNQGEIVFQ